jgi:hypothetical protein
VTLGDLLLAAVADAGVDVTEVPGGGMAFAVGTTTVAAVSADGATAEFRLDPAVALAAQRTPDTSTSERGPDWVRFTPATLDPHAADRAVAWLGSAARRVRGA